MITHILWTQIALCRSLFSGSVTLVAEVDGMTGFLDFLILLLQFFCLLCLIVIGLTVYRNWKRNRLTNPRKDHYKN